MKNHNSLPLIIALIITFTLPCLAGPTWQQLEVNLIENKAGAWKKVLDALSSPRDKLPASRQEQYAFRRLLRRVATSLGSNTEVYRRAADIAERNKKLLIPEIGMLRSRYGLRRLRMRKKEKEARALLEFALKESKAGQLNGFEKAKILLALIKLDVKEGKRNQNYQERLNSTLRAGLRIFIETEELMDANKVFDEQDEKKLQLTELLKEVQEVADRLQVQVDANKLLEHLGEIKNARTAMGNPSDPTPRRFRSHKDAKSLNDLLQSWKGYIIAIGDIDPKLARKHIEFLTKNVELNFGNLDLRIVLASQLVASGKPKEALDEFAKVEEIIVKSPSYLTSQEKYLLGDRLMSLYRKVWGEKKLQEIAEKILKGGKETLKSTKSKGFHSEQLAGLYRQLAYSYEKTGDIDKAVFSLRQVAKYIKKKPRGKKTLGDQWTAQDLKEKIGKLNAKRSIISRCADWFGGSGVPKVF